ncbi:hypothetical protein VT06_13455 [Arsukibacterium sp. MJ3]|uniref:YhdP family protein n=1 Tax=Arsukibacterium sp. MJ3 TaxID=1632859 RepID=UPI00062714EB|nr:YhdP family protein [Arsukibacterium sp. MJ3]KKO48108.1 hypothetical protein VT06_13455 [Arsukibacterium sp. MJ3]
MQQLIRVCFYCLHKIWLLLAVGLVLIATLVSLLRLALPYADHYKTHIEQLISTQLGTEVQIGQISADWQKLGPAMVLNHVQLGDPQQNTPLTISQTRVSFDFWQSLRSLQLRAEHFELSGLRYTVASSALLKGPPSEQPAGAPVIDALEQLLFRQLNHFTLLNSELVLTAADSNDIVISVQKLDWRNDGEHHQGIGELAVAGVTANTLSFIIDLYGPTLAKTNGQIYLDSRELDILPWFGQWLPETKRLAQADISFQAWGRVEQGELQRFQIELAENSLNWQRQGVTHQLKLGPGQLLWQPKQHGWALYSGALALSDGNALWPDLTLQLHRLGQQQGWHGQVQQLTLDALAPLSLLLGDELPQFARLSATELQGELNQAQWQYRANNDWQLQGKLSGLSTTAVADLPGVSHLAGQFWANSAAAGLTLSGQQGELLWDSMFSAPIAYQQLQLEVLARQSSLGYWQIQLPLLQLQAADFNLNGSMQWSMQHTPELSLFAELTAASTRDIRHYLPLKYLPEQVRDYLSNAIDDATIPQARVLWQGPPEQFPFRAAEGVFQVDANVTDATFQFNADWPALQQLNSQLWFENAAMHISADEATIAGLTLQGNVTADITDLFDAEFLSIQINSAAELNQLNPLLNASPLADSLGNTLQQLGPSGPATLDIGLKIGLRQPIVSSRGAVTLNNVNLDLTAPKMAIRQLSGVVQFNDNHLDAKELNFNWRGVAATADISGQQQDNHYLFKLNANASNGSDVIAQALWPAAQTLVSGNLNWQLALALQLQPENISYSANLSADLTTTELHLPAPYAKPASVASQLHITVNGDNQQGLLALNYADKLYFTAELDHTKAQVKRANLSLGQENAGLNGAHFTIDVDIAQAELLPWQQLLSEQLLTQSTSDNRVMPPLTKIRGRIAQLQLFGGAALTNTVFELEPSADSWLLTLNGTEIASRWTFYHNWQQQGLLAEIDYLRLPITSFPVDSEQPVELLPLQAGWQSLPPVTVKCQDCTIGHYQFGQVTMSAQGQGDRWQLNEFISRYKQNELILKGSWFPDQQAGVTALSGNFKSANLGALLNELELTTGISGSRADINFTFNWPAAPQQFTLAKLNGQIDFSLGEGALTEVSDQGARLFSIFSLDSLVRKLRLDFRDIFSKGFFYNKMSGQLAMQQGVVQTSNTSIDGVPGNLAIQGYADVVSKKLDYQMSFSPKVTSSLPVIIAWMVNPATGLAALALDEVFQSAEVISRINFTVTGSFEQPVVTEVNRHSTEVPVPQRIAQPEAAINLEEQQPRGDD